MKLKNLFLAVIAAGAALVGCDPNEIVEDAFNVSGQGEVTIEKIGGSYSFTVESSFDWVIRGVDEASDWLDVQVDEQSLTSSAEVIKGSEKAHEVTVSALNNEGKDRSVTLTIYADIKHKFTLKVTQEGDLGDGVPTVTVAELIANPVKGNTYRLSGAVSGFNATYCSFDLTDATGSIYVYSMDEASKTAWKDKIKNGGSITITGQYDYYESKNQHEIVKAVVEEYTAPEGGDPDKATDATVAEFINKADVVGYYRLSGTVSGFNATYCSFDLTDATGSIYVYSLEDASKEEWKDKIKNGYKVVLRGQYAYYAAKQQHEVVNAIIDSVEVAQAEAIEVSGLVLAVSKFGFLVQTADGIAYVYDKDIEVAVKVGDEVTVNGEKTVYNGIDEIENYTVEVKSSNNELPEVEATELDAEAFDAYDTMFGYVKFGGKLVKSGNYYNVTVPDAKRKGSLSSPATVSEDVLDKWVDITGYFLGTSTSNGATYFNVMYTDITAWAEQPADEPVEEPGDATVGEDEVGYELTNAEIIAALSQSSATADTYADFTFASAGGDWTGNVDTKKTLTYVQFRNNRASYIKSPEYAKNVKRIVIRFQEQTVARKVYALPVSTIASLPNNGKDDTYTKHSDLITNAYGFVQAEDKVECTKVITVTGTTNQFALIAWDGSVYVNSILVICEK